MIDTRNQTWASDKSRFGLKMLQKMGWSEGKGLGRDENGRTDAIRAKKNFEKEGLGVAVVKNSAWDAPAQMAQGLNSVLAKLSSSNSVYGKQERDEPENASNRAVGFYARRAAHKDVKAYSSDALREIFGGVAAEKEISEGKKHKKKDTKKDTKGVKDGVSQVGDETERKRARSEKRKKRDYERLGVASKIRKPHKGDKKKRKRKKEKTR